MIVLTNTGGVAMTNCYLIADEIAKKAVLFDAPDHTVAPLLDEAVKRGWDVQGLWLTHGHFDHFSDHTVVRQRFPNSKNLIHVRALVRKGSDLRGLEGTACEKVYGDVTQKELLPDLIRGCDWCFHEARRVAFQSTPGCFQNRRSSAARVACIRAGGICAYVTRWRIGLPSC